VSELHRICGCERAERRADVVFIHGLGGDAFTTWRHGEDESASWRHWLGKEFPEVGVWSLGYAASPTKWTRLLGWLFERWREAGHGMALPDRAREVLGLMVQHGLGERPLFFIGHGFGGLVAKQFLRMSSDADDARTKKVFVNTRAVMFPATPHTGAGLASLAGSFRKVLRPTVTLQDLGARDPHLRELYDWYRRHTDSIHTATYYETRGVGGVIIVDFTAAHPGTGDDPVPLDEDHFSIAKPRQPGAQVCLAARDLLRDHVLAPRPPRVRSRRVSYTSTCTRSTARPKRRGTRWRTSWRGRTSGSARRPGSGRKKPAAGGACW
jgi:pimeloyl-ACP methyl ester carboxylesterase